MASLHQKGAFPAVRDVNKLHSEIIEEDQSTGAVGTCSCTFHQLN